MSRNWSLSHRCHKHAPRSERHRPQAFAFGGVVNSTRSLESQIDELEGTSSIQPDRTDSDLLTLDEVQSIAARRGLYLNARTLGPLYRIVIRDRDEEGPVLAVSSGFTVPAMGLMHCDSLQIFTRGVRGSEGERLRGGVLGLGLLMGGAVFSFGHSVGCTKAEILAIKDDDAWHKRLVRYYSYFGFERVRAVGDNGLRDLPDLLVWGGVGMRMDADIEELLRRWTVAIRRSDR
ncbi:hypothetical protein WJX75_004873 [Coccomyxa subellipsoidea]|uniref:N-acetyltransferase domain-containing protein n=1 Tax=Coccomyxa subellipsoidea TaxID=248742 RepID=A0ABR2YGK1_9CHLO